MEAVYINNIEINITRKKIKNINITITSNKSIKVSAPHKTNLKEIDSFVQSKKDWLLKHLSHQNNHQEQTKRNYLNNETHYFWGKPYTLNIIDAHNSNNNNNKIEIIKNNICIYITNNILKPKYLLNKWYHEQLDTYVKLYLEQWQNITNIKIKSYNIGYLKSRWGCCYPGEARIWLNRELVKLPLYCLEYVIVHELVHMLEASHNHRFKHYMDKYLPNWRSVRKYMRTTIKQQDMGLFTE